MAGSIAKAYVQIIPSAEGIKGKLSNVFNDEMPSAGQDAGGIFGSNLAGKIKGLIAAAGIGKLLSDSIMAGANMEQSLGGIETLFKDSSDIVIKNAEQAYKTAGMSANEYMETVTSFSASLLQGLSGDTEAAAAAADMALTDMSDNANKMGTSMELIQNAYQGFAKQNYTMLDNLKLGYGGTKSEMERLLADAQKLTGVEYDISNLSDVYSAIHVIQGELGITGTTAKEAASTISGSFASMKAAFGNFMANLALGEDLDESLEALTETVFTFLGDNLLPAVGSILEGLPAVLSTAFSMAIRGLNIAADNADVLLQQGVDLVINIGNSIITALPYLAEACLNLVGAIGKAFISTDWVQVGKDTINGLRSSLDLAAAEILGTDGNIVQSVLDAISTGLPSILEGGVSIVVEMANGLLSALPDFLSTAGELLIQMIDTWLSMLPDIWESGVELVSELAAGLMENLPAITESAADILAELLATIGSHLPDLLESGIELIGELAAGLIQAIPDIIAAIPEIIGSIVDSFSEWDWAQIGEDIVNAIADGITSAAGVVLDAVKDLGGWIVDGLNSIFGSNSSGPSIWDEFEGVAGKNNAMKNTVNKLTAATATTATIDAELQVNSSAITPAPNYSYGDNNVSVSVYASENQNVEELAEAVMNRIQDAVSRREVSFAQ